MEKLNRIGRPGDRSARAAGRLGVRRYGEDDVRVRDRTVGWSLRSIWFGCGCGRPGRKMEMREKLAEP